MATPEKDWFRVEMRTQTKCRNGGQFPTAKIIFNVESHYDLSEEEVFELHFIFRGERKSILVNLKRFMDRERLIVV